MKIIIVVTVMIFIIGCNSSNKESYKILNSETLPDTFLLSGNDTIAFLGRAIRMHSTGKNDTSMIFLPDSKAALNFGRYILYNWFDKGFIKKEEPFKLSLIDNKYWYIEGTHTEFGAGVEMAFSKYDCQIIYFWHDKPEKFE